MRKKLSQYFVPVTLALGAALRLLLIIFPRNPDDDSDVYLELGRNLFHHGIYGIADDGTVYPSLFRLPGYPIFMALHGGHTLLILLTQTVLDLLTCWLLYRMMLRERGETAARWTLALSSLCLFTAAYAATPLAESLSVTCVGIAMYALARYLRERACAPLLVLCCGVAMYLRPDGVLLTAAVGLAILLHGRTRWTTRIAFTRAATIAVLATLTLLPWTVRNWRTFHVFQPIAPRHVNDPGEPVNLGFYRWVRTFADDLTTTGNVFWAVGTRPIVFEKLPANACDTTVECVRRRRFSTNTTAPTPSMLRSTRNSARWPRTASRTIRFITTSRCRFCERQTCGSVRARKPSMPTLRGGSGANILMKRLKP